jgi:hypothetical protein
MDRVDRSRWRRRVLGIASVTRNSPNHRWDTIELALECGHRHSVLRLHALQERSSRPQQPTWSDDDLPCTKCMSLDRIRMKLRRPADRVAS